MKNNFIFVKGVKNVDYSVFCVGDKGQKTYFDPIFSRVCPFSSGQQVKRSIINSILEELGEEHAPVTFTKKVKTKEGKSKIGEGPIISTIDPSYTDMILGGYWNSQSRDSDEKSDSSIKRRSPLSISAMSPLHPLLTHMSKENITFDRRGTKNASIKFIKEDGSEISEKELEVALKNSSAEEKQGKLQQFVSENKRATGLFSYEVAIDLRRLFVVNISENNSEVDVETKNKLIEAGWEKVNFDFGEGLVMPKEKRKKIIPALAKALINWRITSNQATTYSPMETLAVAISFDASKPRHAIRAEVTEDENPKAKPVICEAKGTELFTSPSISSITSNPFNEEKDMEAAEKYLIDIISENIK